VDNYEVVNNCAPLPNSAHSTYLQNREVIESIYKLSFEDAYNFRDFQGKLLSNQQDTLPVLGREKKGLSTTAAFQFLAALVPWMILLVLVSALVSGGAANRTLSIALYMNIGLAVAAGILDRVLRSRRNKEESAEEMQRADQVSAT
jgi:hypothetical protein